MQLQFNKCDMYILLWIIYSSQGVFYAKGSALSQGVLFLILIWSFFYFLKLFKTSSETYTSHLRKLLSYQIILGVILILSGKTIQYRENRSLSIDKKEQNNFVRNIEKINQIINNNSLLEEEFHKWIRTKTKSVLILFEPYETRILRKLYCKNLLPSLNKKRKWLQILNYILCESHNDIVKHALMIKNGKINL